MNPEILILAKILALVLSIWFGILVVVESVRGQSISWFQLFVESVSVAVFVALQLNWIK